MSIREPDEELGQGGDADWLCTFNDLMTLLMVFFVLLFTMSSIPDPRFRSISNALQSGLGVLQSGDRVEVSALDRETVNPMEPKGPEEGGGRAEEEATPMVKIAESIVAGIPVEEGSPAVTVGDNGQIRLGSNLLFDTGKAEIRAVGRPVLARLSEALREVPFHLRVEGHTDDLPIETQLYPSNWELSAQRAVNVVKYLVESGGIAPERLSAAGYGSVKPRASNRTAAGRDKNRRVEIVLVERGRNE